MCVSIRGDGGDMELTRSSTFLGAAILVGMLAAASPALAAPSAADRETARTLMEQGRDLRTKGQMKEALKRFQAANDIMHVPTTALAVAQAQVAVGMLVEARDTVATLRQTASPQESDVFKAARAAAEQLDASLTGRVPALTITVKGAGPSQDVTVDIDGVAIPSGVIGLPRTVNPGHHVVSTKTASAHGQVEFDIREAEQKPVEVPLVATTAVAVVPVVAPGAIPAASPETPPSTPPKSRFGTLAYVGIGVAGAGVIAGTITGILTLSKKSTLSGECANGVCGPSSYSDLNSATALATASDFSFAIGGAGAVLAIVMIVRGTGGDPSPAPSAGVSVSPWVAGGVAGVHGSF